MATWIEVVSCTGECLHGVDAKHCDVRKDYWEPERVDEEIRDILSRGEHILTVGQAPDWYGRPL